MGALDIGFDEEEAGRGLTLAEARYRQVLGHFASGVTVVTTAGPGGPHGFTCQAFAALSLSPPLVALAPSRNSNTWARIVETEVFCVNVLTEHQETVARAFATKATTKFEGIGWVPGVTGSPVLAGVLAWVECHLVDAHDGGDHILAVGEVVEMGVARGDALVFYRGGFGRFEA